MSPKLIAAPPVLPERSNVLTALMTLIISSKRSCWSGERPAPCSKRSPIVWLLSNALRIGTGVSKVSMNGCSGLVYFWTVVTMSPRKLCVKLSTSSEKFFSAIWGILSVLVAVSRPQSS